MGEQIIQLRKIPPALVAVVALECLREAMEAAKDLGALWRPREWMLDYYARLFHRDPPEVHEWITEQTLLFARLGGDAGRFCKEVAGG